MSRPLFLGFTDDRTRPTDQPERLPDVRVDLSEDERATGVHVIGAPGTGKSKFLEHWIRQDIRAGRGVCLIDPHGELYDNVLSWCSYLRSTLPNEIIPLNLSSSHIVGFNPFVGGEGDAHTHVNRCIEATVKAWGIRSTDQTPTLEAGLRCVYHGIIENGLTIAEARHFMRFKRGDVGDYLASRISDETIRDDWEELIEMNIRDRRSEMHSTRNKLRRFLTARHLLRFMALAESIDLRRIMDEGSVLLVNLRLKPGTLDAMDARLFGSLLVSNFFDVARARGGRGQPRPRPFYLYCDEFQNFVSPDVAEILPQGRKFGLSLILAHQFLGQLDKEDDRLVEAVMATARTKVVFGGLSHRDAEAMVPALFAGRIDYNEVKRIEYNTEFWPVYGREKVHSKGTADVSNWGFSSGGTILPSGAVQDFSGGSDADGWVDQKGVADIPFHFQERHEVEKKEYWTMEEQKERLAHVLMLQLQRHCFVKPRDGRTVPVLVPKVTPFPLPEATVLGYEAEQAEKAGASTPMQVDQIIAERTTHLAQQAREFFDRSPREGVHSGADHEPKRSTTRGKSPKPTEPLRPAKKKPSEGPDGEEG